MSRNIQCSMPSGIITLILTLLLVMFHAGSDTRTTNVVVTAFVAPQCKTHSYSMITTNQPYIRTVATMKYVSTTTTLNERQWNFNEGQGPFGLKKNAETWNGRVAQVGPSSLAMLDH